MIGSACSQMSLLSNCSVFSGLVEWRKGRSRGSTSVMVSCSSTSIVVEHALKTAETPKARCSLRQPEFRFSGSKHLEVYMGLPLVVDLSADYKVSRDWSVTAYAAHAQAQSVISALFPAHATRKQQVSWNYCRRAITSSIAGVSGIADHRHGHMPKVLFPISSHTGWQLKMLRLAGSMQVNILPANRCSLRPLG